MNTVSQRYVSDELSHFVGRELLSDEETQYAKLVTILKDGILKHRNYNPNIVSSWGIYPETPISSNEMCNPEMICFCDIPLTDIGLHTKKYGKAGLSFSKYFVTGQGGAPVQYVPRGTAVRDIANMEFHKQEQDGQMVVLIRDTPRISIQNCFDEMVEEYNNIFNSYLLNNSEIHDRAMKLRIFLDSCLFSYLKFYDHTHHEAHDDNYYMEREWRVLGSVQFTISDVQTIFLPREYAQQFRKDFPDYCSQLILL